MWIKLVSKNQTDFYTGKLKFIPGKITTSPIWNPVAKCGEGIHFARGLNAVLDNCNHNGIGYLIEVEPIGEIIIIDNKAKAESVETKRILTINEWFEELKADDPDWWNRLLRAAKIGLEELKADDPDGLNRRLRAAKIGLEELKADDPDGWNRRLRAAKIGLEELKADDPDWWNRRLRAAKIGLEELKADDPDGLNRLLRAAKTGQWDNIFKCLK